ncbi:MAG: hypothetical protein GY696_23535 [Gammaproteobacteria bacterium]|nr:hypothetical protein [Gammaproteobacteria bacterium]
MTSKTWYYINAADYCVYLPSASDRLHNLALDEPEHISDAAHDEPLEGAEPAEGNDHLVRLVILISPT